MQNVVNPRSSCAGIDAIAGSSGDGLCRPGTRPACRRRARAPRGRVPLRPGRRAGGPYRRRWVARADGSRGRSGRSSSVGVGAPTRRRATAAARRDARPWARSRRPRRRSARRRTRQECRARDPPRPRGARRAGRRASTNGTPSASYSSRCQLTVGWTTRRPSERRSSVPSSRASRSGWRSGAITAQAVSRILVVAAAIAESRTSELGHGIAGSWFPGSA